MTEAAEELKNELGYHRGLPILHQFCRPNMGDAFNRSMEVAPITDLGPHERRNANLSMIHTGDSYVEVKSEDDPNVILGYDQTLIWSVQVMMIDGRKATAEALDGMARKIAQEEEKKKAVKDGRFSLVGLEGDIPGDGAPLVDEPPTEGGTVSEIRPGVPDDEGASATND